MIHGPYDVKMVVIFPSSSHPVQQSGLIRRLEQFPPVPIAETPYYGKWVEMSDAFL
jgi:hypothetical protein